MASSSKMYYGLKTAHKRDGANTVGTYLLTLEMEPNKTNHNVLTAENFIKKMKAIMFFYGILGEFRWFGPNKYIMGRLYLVQNKKCKNTTRNPHNSFYECIFVRSEGACKLK